jgi:hypothetical protein
MASVPAIVIVPAAVTGPPLNVKPVVPPLTSTDVTVPPPEADMVKLGYVPLIEIPLPGVSTTV